ncbi:hypothetical protein GCM10025857_39600 [Alicyclobacillus contaminans]|nr:hypothetical protein GCM10025857_00070 [Alicyclobacillus contaminans]GMA52603.1 hypothetical protein GCM10025857_39600 [Alicyclobacillus contaminans]
MDVHLAEPAQPRYFVLPPENVARDEQLKVCQPYRLTGKHALPVLEHPRPLIELVELVDVKVIWEVIVGYALYVTQEPPTCSDVLLTGRDATVRDGLGVVDDALY